ncbi:MAG TPA: winged helix-turn-helix domain-containing protein, partial [bacterium]|nr:winged helix-turn-helix domain-containing protein [bacterium]
MIPDFQSFMLPLLRQLEDGTDKRISDLSEALADEFQLSDADKKETLASGQKRYKNRVAWARTYLLKAGLLKSTGWGTVRITAEGKKVLANPPDRISKLYLRQYPGFAEFSDSSKPDPGDTDKDDLSEQSPDERMGSLYTEIRDALADELLQKIKTCSSVFFEQLVVDLLLAMGYGGSREDAGQAIGSSGDNGVDGIIKEDRLGLDVIYIQAKRWDNTV